MFLAVCILLLLYHYNYQPRREVPAQEIADASLAQVIHVVDGDTIKVHVRDTGKEASIRVLGIDCPESRKNSKCQRDAKHGRHGCRWQVPRGKKAKEVAKRLLENASVTLECGRKCRKGAYGRFLRYVRLKNGMDFGQEMLRLGLCEDFGWKYPHKRSKYYRRVQALAKQSNKGIWTKTH